MKDVILGVVGDGVGVGAGVKVGVGKAVGLGVGVDEGLGVGLGVDVNAGVGEGTGVGPGAGVGVGSGISSVSPSVALLALLNKEREDCVTAGLITLTKHTVIISKLPIPRQLHFSFILSIILSLASITYSNLHFYYPMLITMPLYIPQVRLQRPPSADSFTRIYADSPPGCLTS